MRLLSKVFLKILKSKNLNALRDNLNIQVGKNLKMGDFCNFQLHPELRCVQIKNRVNLRSYISLLVGKGAQVTIGNNVFINNYCSVNSLDRIEIGDNTLFGEGVRIYDHNHQYTTEKIEHQRFNTAPVKIGKNCWLGSNVTVLKGVTIGDNVIIGAGVLVFKDIPANNIVKLNQELMIESI